MCLIKYLKRILRNEDIQQKPLKTFLDIDVFDDVLYKVEDNIYRGWVFNKNKHGLYIVYSNGETLLEDAIIVDRPYNVTEVYNKNNILYFNEPI